MLTIPQIQLDYKGNEITKKKTWGTKHPLIPKNQALALPLKKG